MGLYEGRTRPRRASIAPQGNANLEAYISNNKLGRRITPKSGIQPEVDGDDGCVVVSSPPPACSSRRRRRCVSVTTELPPAPDSPPELVINGCIMDAASGGAVGRRRMNEAQLLLLHSDSHKTRIFTYKLRSVPSRNAAAAQAAHAVASSATLPNGCVKRSHTSPQCSSAAAGSQMNGHCSDTELLDSVSAGRAPVELRSRQQAAVSAAQSNNERSASDEPVTTSSTSLPVKNDLLCCRSTRPRRVSRFPATRLTDCHSRSAGDALRSTVSRRRPAGALSPLCAARSLQQQQQRRPRRRWWPSASSQLSSPPRRGLTVATSRRPARSPAAKTCRVSGGGSSPLRVSSTHKTAAKRSHQSPHCTAQQRKRRRSIAVVNGDVLDSPQEQQRRRQRRPVGRPRKLASLSPVSVSVRPSPVRRRSSSNCTTTAQSHAQRNSGVVMTAAQLVYTFERAPCGEPWFSTYSRPDSDESVVATVAPSQQPARLPYQMSHAELYSDAPAALLVRPTDSSAVTTEHGSSGRVSVAADGKPAVTRASSPSGARQKTDSEGVMGKPRRVVQLATSGGGERCGVARKSPRCHASTRAAHCSSIISSSCAAQHAATDTHDCSDMQRWQDAAANISNVLTAATATTVARTRRRASVSEWPDCQTMWPGSGDGEQEAMLADAWPSPPGHLLSAALYLSGDTACDGDGVRHDGCVELTDVLFSMSAESIDVSSRSSSSMSTHDEPRQRRPARRRKNLTGWPRKQRRSVLSSTQHSTHLIS